MTWLILNSLAFSLQFYSIYTERATAIFIVADCICAAVFVVHIDGIKKMWRFCFGFNAKFGPIEREKVQLPLSNEEIMLRNEWKSKTY